MATTKLIVMHHNKGLTQGETFEARCKYVENSDKTEEENLSLLTPVILNL